MSNEGFLEDAATRHQIYVQRYAGGNLKRVAVFLSRAIKTAKQRVSDGLSAYGTKRYTSQIETLQGDLRGIYDDLKGQAQLDLSDFGSYEAQFNATMLGRVVRAVVQLNVPSAEMVSAAAMADPLELEARKGIQRISISGALDQFGTKKAAEIIGEIQIGSSLGETSQQISRRLTSIHQLQQDQAGALVRTMTNHIASTARMETLKANDDILKGWRWISTLDSHTTPMCQDRDQRMYGWDDPKPPGHWGCRSSSLPVLKDEFAREITGSTRPSIGSDGVELVSSKTSYQEWLARQPAAFQREVLGPNRYALFSKGELTLDKFIDDNGKTLTLQQLRALEPQAFERAGM
ncbi:MULTISPECIES: minor capsid protein [Pseudomonas]|uniref:Phage head morphogenesis protein n=2 Tax=Pseudomonas lactis TaxID=1615674 RepID=A0ABS9FM93_9PSED|nr:MULTISPECIES: minor capsid protein [Pseudomonas]MBI6975130.1 minor capsid protein [Pseudomonas lactis]MCF4974140.1 phage head morphogenesis protein [Pseudomonas lactis]MCF5003943.1 phage head morphogenesis protein [Pseudomonas lactis]MCF5010506.1 phage head morphogenesis protein [Pseudomonas lactis]MCF5014703.1 phage head morphogenesis protein [Pseudomonas lactis]